MKLLWLCALLLAASPAYGQTPQPTPPPPFRLNLRVIYNGAKAHPDLAAFIYKSLRELPGVGVVDRDPDAVLLVNEIAHGNQYACTFTVLVPANEDVRSTVNSSMSMYDSEQTARAAIDEHGEEGRQIKSYWRDLLQAGIRKLPPVYRYEGEWIMLDPSPKAALSKAVKTLETTYVEKERREFDYTLAHPFVMPPFHPPPPIFDPAPTPAPKPTP